MEANGFLP
ncbi:Protein of unknown function [Bacillus wiedmannii]|nr:Protein of unknown function [Bacillus wiedmannii]